MENIDLTAQSHLMSPFILTLMTMTLHSITNGSILIHLTRARDNQIHMSDQLMESNPSPIEVVR
jgi:hypothetical protein